VCFCGERAQRNDQAVTCGCGQRWLLFCDPHGDQWCDWWNDQEGTVVCPTCGQEQRLLDPAEVDDDVWDRRPPLHVAVAVTQGGYRLSQYLWPSW
jgi:hypothetical protein